MTSVAIVKGKTPSKMIETAFSLIEAKDLISPKDRVLIKPNYVRAVHPSTGITTDTRVLDGIINFVKRCGVHDIIVGEGGSGDTERAFDVTGIRDVVAHYGVRLVNLNRDTRVNVTVSSTTYFIGQGSASAGHHGNAHY